MLNLFVNQPRWANPDESIGEFIKSIDGKNSCWKAKGPAREAFEILATDIQTYLNKCVDQIPGSDWVTFSIYMVGKTSQKAAPVVMFFCEEPRPRRRVQEVIKKSGILKRYPGIMSGNAARPPDLDKLERLSSEAIFYQDTEKAKGPRLNSPISVSGNKIFVTNHQGNTSSAQIATLGGIVKHNDDTYLFTAGHTFNRIDPSRPLREPQVSNEEWEIDSDSDTEVDKSGASSTDTRAETSTCPDNRSSDPYPTESLTLSDASNLVENRFFDRPSQMRVARCQVVKNSASEDTILTLTGDKLGGNASAISASTVTEGQLVALSADLDYTLIKIKNSSPLVASTTVGNKSSMNLLQRTHVISTGPKDTEVITYTASNGFMTGTLSGTPSYTRLPNSKTFQEVYMVHFNGPLAKGDCGSWVIDAETRGLYGHIIAGCERTGTAYIMSALRVFEDTTERLWGRPLLDCHLTFEALFPRNLETADAALAEVFVIADLDSPTCSDAAPQIVDPKAATYRDLDFSMENKPHIEVREELGVKDESVVRTFMRGPDDPTICQPQADKVEAFCFGASLESLRVETEKASEQPVAWLDERSFERGKEYSRAYRGPLTSCGLYKELRKPRFRYDGPNHSASPRPDKSQHDEPNAERRLIFITDLDRWSIYALIGTASYYQAFALRDAIYKHLAFENYIGVIFPSIVLTRFHLAFHLPYYAWRSSKTAFEDHRRDANAKPLRQSQDVSFLDWDSSSPAFLYEAQISCVVAGFDERIWVAYCFVDTYFDANEEARESVQAYHNDSLEDEGILADPLTFGVINADQSIRNPKEYFLMVFSIRINQVKCEWQLVAAKIQQSIRDVQTHRYSLSQSRGRFSAKEAENHDKKVRKSRDWVVQVRRLSRQLAQDLSKTVNAYERFRLQHAVYFQDLSESTCGRRPLSAIQITFEELESLKKIFESLAERCDDLARDLELHLLLESFEVNNDQRRIAEANKGLSVLVLLFALPIALTTSIFSMNHLKNVIPFIPANFGSFVSLIFIFSVLFGFIFTAHWQGIMGSAGQTSWERKTKWPLLEKLQFRGCYFVDQPTGKPQQDLEKVAA